MPASRDYNIALSWLNVARSGSSVHGKWLYAEAGRKLNREFTILITVCTF